MCVLQVSVTVAFLTRVFLISYQGKGCVCEIRMLASPLTPELSSIFLTILRSLRVPWLLRVLQSCPAQSVTCLWKHPLCAARAHQTSEVDQIEFGLDI